MAWRAVAARRLMQQAALERVNQAVLMGGLIALIAALAIGFFVFRAITRPIDQLTRAAHQLAQGDLSARVAVDDHAARLGSDEISELGTAFNTMASNLQQSEQVRRDMTADIAHELRTPLAVMRGNLEAMLDGVYPLRRRTSHARVESGQLADAAGGRPAHAGAGRGRATAVG